MNAPHDIVLPIEPVASVLSAHDIGQDGINVLAQHLVSALNRANATELIYILDRTRPPPKRIRKQLGRTALVIQGVTTLDQAVYLAKEREVQSLVPYNVETRLPSALAAYDLIFTDGLPFSRVFHNGLLSIYAIDTIFSSGKEGRNVIASSTEPTEQKERMMTNSSKGGEYSPSPITGVYLKPQPSRPEIAKLFREKRAQAVKNIHLEEDHSTEIRQLIAEGERLLHDM